MKYSLVKICLLATMLIAGSPLQAAFLNSDFSSGLDSWTAEGDDVSTTPTEEARLGDDDPFGITSLYQSDSLVIGDTYLYEFDFYTEMSSDVPFGSFPDLFAASLLFIDDISTFDLAGFVYDDFVALVDVDLTGTFAYDGVITGSDKGADWQHFAFEYQADYENAVALFDMFDANFVIDSFALVDNVTLSNQSLDVPEPQAFALMLIGLLGLGICRGRKVTT